MTTQQAIEKAIEGGWNKEYKVSHHGEFGDVLLVHGMRSKALIEAEILLDPFFWQALGKSMGWKEEYYIQPKLLDDSKVKIRAEYIDVWHRFIDHLAEGKDIKSYFESL